MKFYLEWDEAESGKARRSYKTALMEYKEIERIRKLLVDDKMPGVVIYWKVYDIRNNLIAKGEVR